MIGGEVRHLFGVEVGVFIEGAAVDVADGHQDAGGRRERRVGLLVGQGMLMLEDATHGLGVEATVGLGARRGLGEGLVAVAVSQTP